MASGDLRVCDLTTGFTGPSATRWLAAFGAQVIKVEDIHTPDVTRGTMDFLNLNVGKLSLAIDLNRSGGRRIVTQLAEISNVICVDYPGLGTIGIDINRFESEPLLVVGPEHDGQDPMQWLELTTAVLHSLLDRQDSTILTPDHQAPKQGNAKDVYVCRDGDVAIECRDDGDWAALAIALDFDVEAATKGEAALSAKDIAAWCRKRSRWEVEVDLRSVGVPVAALRSPAERIDADIATGARHLWPMVDHPELGGIRVEGIPVEMSKTPATITEPAPLLGQDNQWVLSELLGRGDSEIERLIQIGVVG